MLNSCLNRFEINSYFIYGRKLFVTDESIAKVMQLDENKAIKDRKLMHESVIVIILVALCFIFHDQLGVQSCTVAIAAACSNSNSTRLYA